MRPLQRSAAHKTDNFGELVCSNSLKTEQIDSAPWLLKQELRQLDSLLLKAAREARVPGGHALTVDREVFSAAIARVIEQHPLIEIERGEVQRIPEEGIVVVASGPLTSDSLADDISRVTGSDRLFFFDSISPIVAAESVDMSLAFRASRWDKSLDGSDDYINCPLDKSQYYAFVEALIEAEHYEPHIEADRTPYFEACLPVEEIAGRGRETLRFGPMKAAGLTDHSHRSLAIRRRPITTGKPALRQLQPGWLSESHAVRGSGPNFPHDPRAGECGVSAFRADAPQYLYQLASAAAPQLAAKKR